MYDRKKELKIWISGRDKLEQKTYNAVKDELISIAEKFDKTDQSGATAPLMANMVSNVLKKLMLGEILNPITEENVNWSCDHFKEGTCQSRVLSSLFKDKTNGKVRYLDAFSWCLSSYSCWGGCAYVKTGNKMYKIPSRMEGIKFPFVPKTFHINVSQDPEDENSNFMIEDLEKLKEGLEYYGKTIDEFIYIPEERN